MTRPAQVGWVRSLLAFGSRHRRRASRKPGILPAARAWLLVSGTGRGRPQAALGLPSLPSTITVRLGLAALLGETQAPPSCWLNISIGMKMRSEVILSLGTSYMTQ